MATVRYFAAAAAAAGLTTQDVPAGTLGELRSALVDAHGDEFARVLARCTTLVDGRAESADDAPLELDTTVDVLPPFAGG